MKIRRASSLLMLLAITGEALVGCGGDHQTATPVLQAPTVIPSTAVPMTVASPTNTIQPASSVLGSATVTNLATPTGETVTDLATPTGDVDISAIAEDLIAPEGDPQFVGSGIAATEVFPLDKGLVIFRHVLMNGMGDFKLVLQDAGGRAIASIVIPQTMNSPRASGATDTTSAINIPIAGNYRLNVTADGDWAIGFSQPKAKYQVPPETQAWRGHSQQATKLFPLKAGAAHFKVLSAGSAEICRVTLLDQDGQMVELIANSLGGGEIKRDVNIPANGVFLLQVQYLSNWIIGVTQ